LSITAFLPITTVNATVHKYPLRRRSQLQNRNADVPESDFLKRLGAQAEWQSVKYGKLSVLQSAGPVVKNITDETPVSNTTSAYNVTTVYNETSVYKRALDADSLEPEVLIPINGTGTAVSAMLENDNDVSYYAQIQVGTPAVDYLVIMDTASANLWLTSAYCPNCTAHHAYNPELSLTYQAGTGLDATIQYGTGQVTGPLISDTLQFGNLTVENQTFLMANSEDAFLIRNMQGKWDGIWGLAYQGVAAAIGGGPLPKPPFERMMDSGVLDQPIFSFWLGDELWGTNNYTGEVVLGGCNPEHFIGQLECFAVTANTPTLTFWQTTLTSLYIGNTKLKLASDASERQAILDTGSTFIGLGPDLLQAVVKELGARPNDNQLYLVDCNSAISQGKDFQVGLQGKTFRLQPKDYLLPADANGTQCVLGFHQLNNVRGVILGGTFLRKFYSVYDVGTNAIGLAMAAPISSGQTNRTASCRCEASKINAAASMLPGRPRDWWMIGLVGIGTWLLMR